MNKQARTDQSVVFISFSQNHEAGITGENREKQAPGKLLQFCRPEKKQIEKPKGGGQPVRKEHLLDTYIDMLLREKLVSPREHNRLYRALQPLMDMFPDLEYEIIKSVRAEFKESHQPTKYDIADEEQALWSRAAVSGQSLIQGFDLESAHAQFTLPRNERPQKVFFLRPEFKKEVPEEDVPFVLFKGEVFFFIILRMFRRHFDKTSALADTN